ncbi:MAG TPA: arginine--tRNA ligase [Tepidisphaeraceae bacterium]|nr:arginine--tRNA ligase [Tepidisphaeraceae bacterium]
MQTIVSQLEQAFRQAVREAFDLEADPLLGVSQNPAFGDYQSNVAMGLAKRVAQKTGQKTNPRAVAEQIKSRLRLGEMAQEISIAGPGFINVRLAPQWLADQLEKAAKDPTSGQPKPAGPDHTPETVVVDYSGPNIAKQMHVGHLRSTIIGDAIARVLEFQGHHVIRQNHIGDWGTQFGMVILGIWHLIMARHRGDPDYVTRMYARLVEANQRKDGAARQKLIEEIYRNHQSDLQADPTGEKIFVPAMKAFVPRLEEVEPAYKFVNAVEEAPEAESLILTRHGPSGARTIPLSKVSNDVIAMLQAGGPENEQEERVWEKVRQATLEEAQRLYERLDVSLRPEYVRGESSYRQQLAATVEELRRSAHAKPAQGADYPAISVEESEGAVVVFHRTPAGEALFRNKENQPLPFLIRKSDGAYLYATTDLAAVRHRVLQLHADRIIYVTDARQALHFEMLFATVRGAGWTRPANREHEVRLEHVTFGSITGEDGKPIKTRQGESVKLADLLDEAEERALAVVTTKNPELPEAERKRIAHSVGVGAVKYADLSKDRVSDYVFSWDKMLSLEGNTAPYLQYQHARIMSIFRKGGVQPPRDARLVLQMPQELNLAKQIARFGEIIDLVARELKPHQMTTYLYELASRFSAFYTECPVLKSEEPTRSSRLLLCDLTARTMAAGLDLLGIEHPDEM